MDTKLSLKDVPGGEEPRTNGVRPRMVLAHSHSAYSASIVRNFRRLGWEVHQVESGEEARRLAQFTVPTVVVLETDNLPGESGWLACEKIAKHEPTQRVILVGSQATKEKRNFAAFVGACGLVSQEGGAQALVDEIYGPASAVAG